MTDKTIREKIAEIEHKPPRWKDCEHAPLAPWNPVCDTCFADAILAIPEIKEGQELREKAGRERPEIVCLCGSTRFGDAFQKANLDLTLVGIIVLSIGCNMKTDGELFDRLTTDQRNQIKVRLDKLHLRKIDLADRVYVLNVGGYIGDSTRAEVAYAESLGKRIEYLEPLVSGLQK